MAGRMSYCCCVVYLLLLLLVAAVGAEKGGEEGEGGGLVVNHVVGEDRGWESSSDISSWSSKRLFMVGDHLWFAYSAAEEIVAELRSKEEYETCNVSNPIRMYTEGLNKVILEQQGPRYFASGSPDKCRNGLKLHINVLPKGAAAARVPIAGIALSAEPPSTPSPSPSPPQLKGGITAVLLWVGFAILY